MWHMACTWQLDGLLLLRQALHGTALQCRQVSMHKDIPGFNRRFRSRGGRVLLLHNKVLRHRVHSQRRACKCRGRAPDPRPAVVAVTHLLLHTQEQSCLNVPVQGTRVRQFASSALDAPAEAAGTFTPMEDTSMAPAVRTAVAAVAHAVASSLAAEVGLGLATSAHRVAGSMAGVTSRRRIVAEIVAAATARAVAAVPASARECKGRPGNPHLRSLSAHAVKAPRANLRMRSQRHRRSSNTSRRPPVPVRMIPRTRCPAHSQGGRRQSRREAS